MRTDNQQRPAPNPVEAHWTSDDWTATTWLRRAAVCGVFFAVVFVLTTVPAFKFPGWHWVALALSTPVVTWGAWPIYSDAIRQFRWNRVAVDAVALAAVAVPYLVAFTAFVANGLGSVRIELPVSWVPVWLGASSPEASGVRFLMASSIIVILCLIGRFNHALPEAEDQAMPPILAGQWPTEVTVCAADGERRIPVADLQAGERFRAMPGERLVADARVVGDGGMVDTLFMTGRSGSESVSHGDVVSMGAIVVGEPFVAEAIRVGADTHLSRLIKHVNGTRAQRRSIKFRIDHVIGRLAPFVFLGAGVTFAAWLATGQPLGLALGAATAVFVVACPCALGLAASFALRIAVQRAVHFGVQVRMREAMTSVFRVDTIVLDRRSALVTGRDSLTGVYPVDGIDENEFLRLAYTVSIKSNRRIVQAVIREGEERGLEALPISGEVVTRDRGLKGIVDGRMACGGRMQWVVAQTSQVLLPELASRHDEASARGHSTLVFVWDDRFQGLVEIGDPVNPVSVEAVAEFKRLGMEPILITGESAAVAQHTAEQVGIARIITDVDAAGKAEAIRRLQAAGRSVAMVGAGVSSVLALGQADLGIAIGPDASVAAEVSDMTVIEGDIMTAVDAVRLSGKTNQVIRSNVFWAVFFHLVAIPVAAFGFIDILYGAMLALVSCLFIFADSLRLFAFRSERQMPKRPQAGAAGGPQLS
ncbi:MAG: HAD-IC family P-type ATPase [Propionibacteriaceae bacterium]|nr:HAD-IC family P-type ATPase [Propionibacteriaceae bacterium]